MNEACLNFLGKDVGSPEGLAFALEIMHFLRRLMVKFQEETGHFYNLEATPAEGTSYRLAKLDKARYPEIITAGKEEPLYTNSSQLPWNIPTIYLNAATFRTNCSPFTRAAQFSIFTWARG